MEQLKKLWTGPKAVEGIKHFESLHDGDLSKIGLQPKMDPVGIWTVGWGHALTDPKTGKFLKGLKDRDKAYAQFPSLSEYEAGVMLQGDLIPREKAVLGLITRRDLTLDQFGCLVSFYYNCGAGYKNVFGKFIPYQLWANVDKWNPQSSVSNENLLNYWKDSVIKAGGQTLLGLIRRRNWEANLFVKGTVVYR